MLYFTGVTSGTSLCMEISCATFNKAPFWIRAKMLIGQAAREDPGPQRHSKGNAGLSTCHICEYST